MAQKKETKPAANPAKSAAPAKQAAAPVAPKKRGRPTNAEKAARAEAAQASCGGKKGGKKK